jgi:hypothetical protein
MPQGETMTELPNAQARLIGVLRQFKPGQWVNRTDLARQLHKQKLNPVDCAMLDLMADNRLIEKQSQPGRHPGVLRFAYRLKATETPKPSKKRSAAKE